MVPNIDIAPEQSHEVPLTADIISDRLAALKSQHEKKEIAPDDYKKKLDEMKAQIERPQGVENATPEALNALRAEFDSLPAEIGEQTDVKVLTPMPAVIPEGKETGDQAQVKVLTPMPAEIAEGKETWYKPQTWSPETKDTAEAVGLGVGIGIGVMGLALLAKAAWGKTKEVAKATGEKAGWLWGKVKWAIGLTVVAGLGYVGVRVYQDYRKLDGLKTQVESLVKALPTLTGEKLIEAQQKIQELQREIQDIKDGVTTADSVAQETTPEAAPSVADTVKEGAHEVKENITEVIMARMILELSDTEEWALDPVAKKNQMAGLISNNREKKIGNIEDDPESVLEIPVNTNDIESRLKSVEVLLRYCESKRPQAIARVMKDQNLTAENAEIEMRGMQLKSYLELSMRDAIPFAKNLQYLQDAPQNLEGILKGIQEFDQSGALIASEGAKQAMRDMVRDIGPEAIGITEEEMKGVNISDLLVAALSLSGTTLANEIINLEKIQDRNPSQKTLLAILRKIADEQNETNKVILPFFHGVYPDEKGSIGGDQNDHEQKIRNYLLNQMKPQEAIRFYLYHQMIKGGNALAIPLVQLDVIRFIARHDDGYFPGSKKAEVIAEMTKSAALTGTDKIQEEWEKMNIHFDIALTEEEENALAKFGLMLAAIPFKGAKEGFTTSLGILDAVPGGSDVTAALGKIYENQPWLLDTPQGWLTLYAAASTVTGAVEVVGKRTRVGKWAWEGFRDPEKFAKLLEKVPKRGARESALGLSKNWMRNRLSPLIYTPKELDKAKNLYHTIFHEGIKKLTNSAQSDKATKLLQNCIGNPRIVSHWTALADYLDSVGSGSEEIRRAASKARLLTRPEAARIRGVLSTLRIPMEWTKNLLKMPHNIATVGIDRFGRAALGPLKSLSGLRTAQGAGKFLKVVGKGMPIAFAIYEGVGYEVYEREELQKQFDAETDPLKRKIIYNDMMSKRGNWITSAASGPFVFTPIGATVFFGNMARQHANDSINAGTREMLEDRRDWVDKTPGQLLEKVQRAAPGKTLTYGHWLAKNPITDTETFDAANTSIRSEAYATYFKQNAFLPPVSADMLTEQEAMDPAVSQRRLTILQEDQTNNFTQSALSYLSHVTDRTFVSVDAEILHRALVYAYRCSEDWRLMMLGKETMFTKKDWAEKETAITDIITQENEGLVATANDAIKSGEKPEDVLPFFYMESLKDNLAMCEANILNTDYSNWSYWDLNPFDASSNEKMQQAARTVFAEKITATLETICDKTGPLTKESFASGREALISVLKSDPNKLAQEGFSRSESAGIIEVGADPALLSVDGMLGYMQTYSEATDRTLAA